MRSKSVLIIIPHLGVGGTEIQTLNIVKALTAGGYRVNVVCLYRNIPSMVDAYRDAGANVEIASPEYCSYDVAIKYPSVIKSLIFLFNILRHSLKKYSPDVVHVQYMTPGATVILMLKYLFGVNRIIATSHTAADIYSPKALKLLKFITKHCLRGFQCITEASEKGYFGTSELFNDKTHVGAGSHFTIHNSLPDYIAIRDIPKQFDSTGRFTVGVVSRLERIKGMDFVVPAFARVAKQYPDAELLIVGEGTLHGLMAQQSIDFGISDKIKFVGRKTQSELQQWYDKIDILLMPSRSEGFGLTAIEGMARGCVPVVAHVGGLPEVVSESCGLLHTSGDIHDMSSKVIDALKNIETFSKASIEHARFFSAANFNKSINKLYSRL